jgi:hypothetical protein
MRVETDTRLVRDELWSALDRMVIELREDPYPVIFEGLEASANAINKMAADADCGTIFGHRDDEHGSYVEIYHPLRADIPITWRVQFKTLPLRRQLQPKRIERMIAYLEAWQERRAGQLEVEREDRPVARKRRCYDRDYLWLKWYETEGQDTYHSPAKIRDRWNTMSESDRQSQSPRCSHTIGKDKSGRQVVERGLKQARQDQKEARASQEKNTG